MKSDNTEHHRRSIRLRGYDYSLKSFYFVTVCTEKKEPLFGKIVEGEMVLSEAGQVAKRAWEILPQRFAPLALDAFVVMPNHTHGVVQIVGAPLAAPQPLPTLGGIMRAFKSTSAILINRLLDRPGYRVWQRNYYERIVRNHQELETIRQYIAENPVRWASDRENPEMQLGSDLDMAWV